MKPFYRLLLPALLFTTVACAQKNFRPGYIINMKGDTLRGSIDYQEWVHNPTTILFKDASGQTSSQTPANTKAFYLKQAGYYESYTLPLTHDIISAGQTINFLDSAKAVSTVFLKRMIAGKYLNLYTHVDKNRLRYVIVDKKSNRASELTYHYYFYNAVATSYNEFRNELLNYAQDRHLLNDKLLGQIKEADYEEKDIVALINGINGETLTVEAAKKETVKKEIAKKETVKDADAPKAISIDPHSYVNMFAGVALNAGQLHYTGFIDLADNPKSHTNFLPQLSFGLDFSPNPDVSRILIRLELSAYSGQLVAESANAQKKVDMFNLMFKPQIIYNFYIKDPVKLFISSGFVYNVSSYSNLQYTVTNNRYNIIAGQQPFNTKWVSIPARAGVLINRRIEIYGAYNFVAGLDESGPLQFSGTFDLFQAGINYHFGKK